MADISAWSPVDESNTLAPPDGWPEFMMPSLVNNSARAMMGAVRRWYDDVLDGSLPLPYLPTTGGGMTGGLTVNSPAGISTTGGITASGNISGANISTLGTVSAGALNTTGSINVQGGATITGGVVTGGVTTGNLVSTNATISGTASVGALSTSGNINVAGSATITGGIVTGGVTAGNLVSTGDISAANNATITGTATVGALAASGTVTGAAISSSGGINAAGTINAAQYNIAGLTLITSVGSATSIYDGSGSPNIVLDSGGANYYRGVSHSIMNRPATISYAVFNSTGTYNASGSWLVISDDAVKTDVQPYTAGLAELRRLNPVSFVYSAGAAFRDDAGTTRYGLLASEVAPIVPEMVGEAELEVDGDPVPTRTLQPGHLVYLLINGCKTLADRLETLEAQISAAR